MKQMKHVWALLLACVLAITGVVGEHDTVYAKTTEESASMAYVKAMGSGWNLGNSLDSVLTDTNDPDLGEELWGNPKVTKKLLKQVKKKGYKSIRIPLTFYRRYTVNEQVKDGEYQYIINADYLKRAKEVIDWALDDGFYVVINIHHDSWIWLADWDGTTTAKEYRMYTDFWKQLAETFKEEPDRLCFETINEYSPSDSETVSAQEKVMAINKAAYDCIRQSGGNNATRMIVLPTLYDNYEEKNSSVLRTFMDGLNDTHVIASVHYYSEWVYSANLGRIGFDEDLFGEGNYTPRDAVDRMMQTLREQFLDAGIGVIVGEYGLLGYDQGEHVLQTGEEIKYYDYINRKARENNVCLMFWDNGSGIDRTTGQWKKLRIGKALETAMTGNVSYTTGLDTIYLTKKTAADIKIPLTLNGNKFIGIKNLKKGTEYTYNKKKALVTIKKSYIKKRLKNASYGTLATWTFEFDNGCNWQESLVLCAKPVFGAAKGTTKQVSIPVTFYGNRIRSIAATQNGNSVGPNSSWWKWLQNGAAFQVDETAGTLVLTETLLCDPSVSDGTVKLEITCYGGQRVNLTVQIKAGVVTVKP